MFFSNILKEVYTFMPDEINYLTDLPRSVKKANAQGGNGTNLRDRWGY